MAYVTTAGFKRTNIDATTAANHVLTTTNNSLERFYPLTVVVEVTAVSGLVTPATFSVGTNASTYNNIVPATAMTGLSGANVSRTFAVDAETYPSVAPNTDIVLRISLGAVATTLEVKALLLGIYDTP